MPRNRNSDLADFHTWLIAHEISELSAMSYTSLVRRVIAESSITAESLTLYEQTLNAKTAAQMRSAWRWFVEYAVSKDIHLPNPFGARRRAAPASLDSLQKLANQGYTPGKPMPGSALGAAAVDYTVPPVSAQIPENVLEPLREWATFCKLGADVLVKMKWEWTRFVKETGNWVTAHPAIKYSWVVIPPELLDTLGEWGYGEQRPEEGPLIPKSHRSTEPFPKLALRLLIGDGT